MDTTSAHPTGTPLPDSVTNALMSIRPRYNSFHQHNGIPNMPGNSYSQSPNSRQDGTTGNPSNQNTSNTVQPATTSVINLSNSSDVVIGPMTQYQGSVTIYQYMDATVEASRIASGRNNQNRGLPSPEQSSVLRQERYFLYGALILLTIIAFSTALYFIIHQMQNSGNISSQPDILFGNNYASGTIPNLGNGHLVIDRHNWGAQETVRGPYPLISPIPYVLITHIGVQSSPCFDMYKCSIKMRTIQDAAIAEQGLPDIPNNFYLGGDGYIYVGRGWNIANAYANQTLSICFMGDFVRHQPNENQFSALDHLLAHGVAENYLAKDYKLVAHNQTKVTKSPGPYAYARISKMPRWVPCTLNSSNTCGSEIGLPSVWKQDYLKKNMTTKISTNQAEDSYSKACESVKPMAKARDQQNTSSHDPDATTQSSSVSGNYPSNITDRNKTDQVLDKSDSSSSQNISITSINENDNDSSTFASSDSECDDEQIKKAIERIPNALQPGQLVQNGMLVVNNDNSSPTSSRAPNIGSIAVQNSSDITFGNKTYIKGQVVIKNIYQDRPNGVVNPGYQEGNEIDGELATTKHKTEDSSKRSQNWHSSLKVIIKDKPLLSVAIIIALMVIIVIIVIVPYVVTSTGKHNLRPHYGDGDDDRANVPPDTGIDQDFLPDAKPLRIVTRNEWLAQPPKEDLDPLKLPVHKVIIAHTATEGCTTQTACIYRVRFIQERHISSMNLGDIAYNFLIGGDGNVYEGRGWLKVGAFLRGQNSRSEGIAFIGDYRRLQPTQAQMETLDILLKNGTKTRYLTDKFKLYGARQWEPTDSPGNMLYKRLVQHPNWSDELVSQCVFMTSNIQQFHMADDSKNFSDIAYNFLVGGDGNAYEGRNWNKEGAHTKGFNKDSICIAFIGTFIDVKPPVTQLSAAQQLLALGLEQGKLAKDYKLFGHRQLAPFESPGRSLYKIIQTWPHWSKDLGPNHWVE
ncbi:uncharacterized protein LOC131434187 [Malaya genurostris]|uniref:uncharacterized protein LOC131434187 n=1 Tax=Malaya genurostris TaxID=325434 RepID=UPI0026F399CB|nr:uncharacterized protein LOC131434187 [Malaya genurostris]